MTPEAGYFLAYGIFSPTGRIFSLWGRARRDDEAAMARRSSRNFNAHGKAGSHDTKLFLG
jgi:hypothetical protein